MKSNSARRHIENIGRLLHREAFSQQLQNFSLPQGKLLRVFTTLKILDKRSHHSFSHEGCNVSTAEQHFAQSPNQLSTRGGLEQIGRRSQPESLRRHVRILIHGQVDELYRRQDLLQALT